MAASSASIQEVQIVGALAATTDSPVTSRFKRFLVMIHLMQKHPGKEHMELEVYQMMKSHRPMKKCR